MQVVIFGIWTHGEIWLIHSKAPRVSFGKFLKVCQNLEHMKEDGFQFCSHKQIHVFFVSMHLSQNLCTAHLRPCHPWRPGRWWDRPGMYPRHPNTSWCIWTPKNTPKTRSQEAFGCLRGMLFLKLKYVYLYFRMRPSHPVGVRSGTWQFKWTGILLRSAKYVVLLADYFYSVGSKDDLSSFIIA